MDFQTAYGIKLKPKLDCSDEPSRTKQNHADECDINKIIRRFDTTGVLTHLNRMEAQYGDLVGLDFQTAMDIVTQATGIFQELPSNVRKKFANNPALFLDFMDNPENAEEMVSLGLATMREAESIVPKVEKTEDTPEEPTE